MLGSRQGPIPSGEFYNRSTPRKVASQLGKSCSHPFYQHTSSLSRMVPHFFHLGSLRKTPSFSRSMPINHTKVTSPKVIIVSHTTSTSGVWVIHGSQSQVLMISHTTSTSGVWVIHGSQSQVIITSHTTSTSGVWVIHGSQSPSRYLRQHNFPVKPPTLSVQYDSNTILLGLSRFFGFIITSIWFLQSNGSWFFDNPIATHCFIAQSHRLPHNSIGIPIIFQSHLGNLPGFFLRATTSFRSPLEPPGLNLNIIIMQPTK
jgi:hypothetical protein